MNSIALLKREILLFSLNDSYVAFHVHKQHLLDMLLELPKVDTNNSEKLVDQIWNGFLVINKDYLEWLYSEYQLLFSEDKVVKYSLKDLEEE